MANLNTIETIQFDGGVLCFDFVNTIRSRKVTTVHNYLAAYADFLTLCRRLQMLPESILNQLGQFSEQNPEEAKAALKTIVSMRENLYSLFSAIAANSVPETAVVTTFNQSLSRALSGVFLSWQGLDFSLQLEVKENELAGPLKSILYSAYQILVHEDRKRIKECAECGWLFLDKTKNGKRLWCNPVDCGSTTKARRYYHRQKEKDQHPGEAKQ